MSRRERIFIASGVLLPFLFGFLLAAPSSEAATMDHCPGRVQPLITNTLSGIIIHRGKMDWSTGKEDERTSFARKPAKVFKETILNDMSEPIVKSETDLSPMGIIDFYDVFVSDSRGEFDEEGSYLTIQLDMNLPPELHFTNSEIPGSIDAVELDFTDGTKAYADMVAQVNIGDGLSGEYIAEQGFAERAIGSPDGKATVLGVGQASVTVGFCSGLKAARSASSRSGSSSLRSSSRSSSRSRRNPSSPLSSSSKPPKPETPAKPPKPEAPPKPPKPEKPPSEKKKKMKKEPSPECGNGSIGRGEHCDDGNLIEGDGCGPYCRIRNKWECSEEPSICLKRAK